MEITLKANPAKAAIGKIRPAKGNGKILPILDCYLLSYGPDAVRIKAAGTAGYAEAEIEGAFAKEPGRILVDSAQIERVISLAGEEVITISVGKENVVFYTETGSMSVPIGPDPDDYPQFRAEAEVDKFWLDGDAAEDAVAQVIHAVKDDELRPAMSAICISEKDGQLRFVATDARRLAVASIPAGNDIAPGLSFLVPHHALPMFRKLLDGKVRVEVGQKTLKVSDSASETGFLLAEGAYPNWENVVPLEFSSSMFVERAVLLREVKRAMIAAPSTTSLVVLDWDGGSRLRVSAHDIDHNVGAEYNVQTSGDDEPLRIGFNGTFLVDALSATGANEVEFRFIDAEHAAVLRPVVEGSEAFELLMPLTLS